MNNKLTKRQAVALINKAVGAGFKRKISTMTDPSGTPWNVMVSLTRNATYPNGFARSANCHIIVNFRRSRFKRAFIVSCSSRYSFQRKMKPGAWSAGYHLNEVIKDNATV